MNTVEKWACVLKPTAYATFASGILVVLVTVFARSIRLSSKYSCGLRPVAARNWAAKYIFERPTAAAISRNVTPPVDIDDEIVLKPLHSPF